MRTRPRSSSRFGTTKPREDCGLVAKLYTTENFPFPAAAELRRLGHDVMTVQGSGLGGKSVSDDAVSSSFMPWTLSAWAASTTSLASSGVIRCKARHAP
jgi:hypothetical protein